MSKKILIGIVCSLFAFTGSFVLFAMAAEQAQNDRLAEVPVIKEQVRQIKEFTRKIENKVDQLDHRMQSLERNQITPAQLKETLKQVIREERKP